MTHRSVNGASSCQAAGAPEEKWHPGHLTVVVVTVLEVAVVPELLAVIRGQRCHHRPPVVTLPQLREQAAHVLVDITHRGVGGKRGQVQIGREQSDQRPTRRRRSSKRGSERMGSRRGSIAMES